MSGLFADAIQSRKPIKPEGIFDSALPDLIVKSPSLFFVFRFRHLIVSSKVDFLDLRAL
jgi:hypothetical protein